MPAETTATADGDVGNGGSARSRDMHIHNNHITIIINHTMPARM